MVANVFSIFDPFSRRLLVSGQKYFFFIFAFVCRWFFSAYWQLPSFVVGVVNQIIPVFLPRWKETKAVSLKGRLGLFIRVFFFIFSFNVLGLMPYVFAHTSHLFFAISLAIPFWFSTVLSSFRLDYKVASARLVPYGVPQELGRFFAILETLSVIIRPLSLRLRLVVNITAGHCLYSFIRQFVIALLFCLPIGAFAILFIHVGYFLLEVGVAFVQAYIFTRLLSLYCDEHVPSKV